ncbi:MAG: cation transporter dimerization domain-containing protein [Candidatus Omnitrophota bacterium]
MEVTIGVDKDKTVQEGHFITTKVEENVCKAMEDVEGVVVHVEPEREAH